jgi:hypothetical protein
MTKHEILTSFRPVVASTALTKDKVVWPEEATEGARSNGIHSSRLEVDQDRARYILVGTDLVVVDRDPLELEVVVSLVDTIRPNTMLIGDDLPELGTYST